MFVHESLARERHQERLSQAEAERSAHQVAELQRLEKRRQRAERQLLAAWQLTERARSALHAG